MKRSGAVARSASTTGRDRVRLRFLDRQASSFKKKRSGGRARSGIDVCRGANGMGDQKPRLDHAQLVFIDETGT